MKKCMEFVTRQQELDLLQWLSLIHIFLPFLFNLVLGLLIVIPASVHVMKLQQFNNIFYLLMLRCV